MKLPPKDQESLEVRVANEKQLTWVGIARRSQWITVFPECGGSLANRSSVCRRGTNGIAEHSEVYRYRYYLTVYVLPAGKKKKHRNTTTKMNDAFLPSILTILFQLVIIGIYLLHNSHFFRYFIPQALRNDEPQQSCKLEDLSGIVTQSASRGFDDPFYLPTHADNFNICSKFTSCHELAFEDLSRNVSTIFMDYKEDKFPTAFSIVDRNYSWEAFNWNLWNFTQFRWPLLHNVLEVERSILANGNALGVFLVSEENAVNEPVNETEPALPALTSSQSLFPEEFSPYTINQEMFFWDFLYDILPNKTFSTENLPKDHCRYYSTNYRVFESFTGVSNFIFPCQKKLSTFGVERE